MATATLERGRAQREKLAEIDAGLEEIQRIHEDVLSSQKRVELLEKETKVLLSRLEELIPDPIERLRNA